MKPLKIILFLSVYFLIISNVFAQTPFYNIGTISVTDYFVDPINGKDTNSGLTRALAKKTVTSIWNSIPTTPLTKGYRINLLPGIYTSQVLPIGFENRHGTAAAPIIIQRGDPSGGVVIQKDILMAGVSYVYLIGVSVTNPVPTGFGRNLICTKCDHVLLRGNNFNGAPLGLGNAAAIAAETVSIQQSKDIFVESNDIQGASDNALEFVAVQYGQIKANNIHNSIGWCASVRAGSSYISVDANKVSDCGVGGITAGQTSGLEEMVVPWVRFEANYVKITNNIIRAVTGAALGVSGGFDILLANNTASSVGSLGHLVEFGFGSRICGGPEATCIAIRNAGGWGPTQLGSLSAQPIGNRNIIFANNIIFNPETLFTGKHFSIPASRIATVFGMPALQFADDGLQIFSNIIWNVAAGTAIGTEVDGGCRDTNPSCNTAQLAAQNKINSLLPVFRDVLNGDFRPAPASQLEVERGDAIADFTPLDTNFNPIPEGQRSNTVSADFSGTARTVIVPGAFFSPYSSGAFQFAGSNGTDTGGGGGSGGGDAGPTDKAPQLSKLSVSANNSRGKVKVVTSVVATDDIKVAAVRGEILSGRKTLGTFPLTLKDGKYQATKTISTSSKSVTVKVTAKDSSRFVASLSKTVKVK